MKRFGAILIAFLIAVGFGSYVVFGGDEAVPLSGAITVDDVESLDGEEGAFLLHIHNGEVGVLRYEVAVVPSIYTEEERYVGSADEPFSTERFIDKEVHLRMWDTEGNEELLELALESKGTDTYRWYVVGGKSTIRSQDGVLIPYSTSEAPIDWDEVYKRDADLISQTLSVALRNNCPELSFEQGEVRASAGSDIRPDFGSEQVRDPAQLVVGDWYYTVHGGYSPYEQSCTLTRVLSAPYRTTIGTWVNVAREYTWGTFEGKYAQISLEDRSILPDRNGRWNQWNYVVFAE